MTLFRFARRLLPSAILTPAAIPALITALITAPVPVVVLAGEAPARGTPAGDLPAMGVLSGEFAVPATAPIDTRALLRGTLESIREAGPVRLGNQPLESGRLLAEFYAVRGDRLAWDRSSQVEALLRAVEASPEDGLDPADYNLPLLRRLAAPGALSALPPAERLAVDLQLSDVLLRFSYHIRFGRVDPVSVSRAWNHRAPVPAASLIASMERVVSAADTAQALAAMAERQPFFYANLKRALKEYGGTNPVHGLAPIPQGRKLVKGNRDPRVLALRQYLSALGDYRDAPAAGAEDLFDQPLRDALVAFQKRSGLTADGVLNNASVAALNQPVSAGKAEQIRMNLERMRWFYDDLPREYVLVDVGGFMAHVVRGDRVDWSTRVVVGTPEQQTPAFRDEMEHVVFNPTWTVPPSIQKKMRGAGKFKVVYHRRGGNISDPGQVSLVQPAGPGNALGRVKFIFPNDHAVYLHDTQSKGLFGQSVRAYSHGCVRVQNPLKLAEVLLGPSGWDQTQINRVVATNRTRYVPLPEHLPVLINYLTATADEHGKVEFRRDIYGRDPALRRAINGPASELRIGFPKPEPLLDPDTQVAKTGGASVRAAWPQSVSKTQEAAAAPAGPGAAAAPGAQAGLTQVPALRLNLKLDETSSLAPPAEAPSGSTTRM